MSSDKLLLDIAKYHCPEKLIIKDVPRIPEEYTSTACASVVLGRAYIAVEAKLAQHKQVIAELVRTGSKLTIEEQNWEAVKEFHAALARAKALEVAE